MAYSLATGDYIQYLDADDLLCPEKIALQLSAVNAARSCDVLLSAAWGRFLHRPHRATFEPSSLWSDLRPTEWLLRKLETNAYMQTATWLVSRTLVDRAGSWNTSLLSDDDGEFFCRVLMQSRLVRFVGGAKVLYRMPSAGSLSYVGMSDSRLEALFESMRLHVGYMRSMDDSPRARKACGDYLQRWLASLHPHRPDLVRRTKDLAQDFGVSLDDPRLLWKYRWIEPLFGWHTAKLASLLAPRMRWAVSRGADRVVSGIEHRLQKPRKTC
jgi:glycosyltransferase involved in cell wall biosynthesis